MSPTFKQNFEGFVESLTADRFATGSYWRPYTSTFRLDIQGLTADGKFCNYQIQVNGRASSSNRSGKPQGSVANVLIPTTESGSLDIDRVKKNFLDSSEPYFIGGPVGKVCETITYEPKPLSPFSQLSTKDLTQEFIDKPSHVTKRRSDLELEHQRDGPTTVVSIKRTTEVRKTEVVAKVVNISGGRLDLERCQKLLRKSYNEGGKAESI